MGIEGYYPIQCLNSIFMKKRGFIKKTGFPVCLGISLIISMQALGNGSKDSLYSYKENDNFFTSNVMLNEISTRAFRHFKRTYPSVSKEEWIKDSEGFSVIFTTNDSMYCRVHYGPAGRFLEEFSFYRQKNIPRNIKESIKNMYGDYSILFASSMNDGSEIIFNVTLVDKYTVRTVEVSDGEVKTINEYRTDLADK